MQLSLSARKNMQHTQQTLSNAATWEVSSYLEKSKPLDHSDFLLVRTDCLFNEQAVSSKTHVDE